MLFNILSSRPRLEVLLRFSWGLVPVWLKKRLLRGKKPQRTVLPISHVATDAPLSTNALIDRFCLSPDETFLLHSSGRGLKLLCGSVTNLAVTLIQRAEADGLTGLIPSYPRLSKSLTGQDNLYTWDVASARQSTGALGEIISRQPKVGRSGLPYNNLTVIGPEAMKLDQLEDASQALYPCGPGTIWATLWKRNAKIVIVGVDIASCLTTLHIPEDNDPNYWDQFRWYEERIIETLGESQSRFLKMRVRREAAARFYAERCFDRDLRQNVFQDLSVCGVPIFVGHVRDVIDYLALRRRDQPTYPYYFTKLLRYV